MRRWNGGWMEFEDEREGGMRERDGRQKGRE